MQNESPPASSDELRKWLREARDARVSIERQLKRMTKAHAHIERLAEKGPRDVEPKDAPGPC